jgi:hypothetical protein
LRRILLVSNALVLTIYILFVFWKSYWYPELSFKFIRYFLSFVLFVLLITPNLYLIRINSQNNITPTLYYSYYFLIAAQILGVLMVWSTLGRQTTLTVCLGIMVPVTIFSFVWGNILYHLTKRKSTQRQNRRV